jgi:hypothetical protein
MKNSKAGDVGDWRDISTLNKSLLSLKIEKSRSSII